MTRVELHAAIALKSADIRRTVAAYNRLFLAVESLDRLPPELLGALTQHVAEEYRGRTGPLADFIKCYLRYIQRHPLPEARARDRMLRHGLPPKLEDYELPPRGEEETDL